MSQVLFLSLFRQLGERFGNVVFIHESQPGFWYKMDWLLRAHTAEALHPASVMFEV